MDQQALTQALKEQYESLPRQVRLAANFVLNHPQEVAVMSMREQSRLAGVPASTMTRLAKRIGLSGYDDIRQIFINAVRSKGYEFSSRVNALVEMQQKVGENSLALDLANTTLSHIQSLCHENNLSSIVSAAQTLSGARKIYCLGLRSSFAVAFQFYHIASYFQSNLHLVEGAGESGLMTLMQNIGPKDALLVCSISPYARRSVALTRYLAKQKVKVVAISDNASSPVARLATNTILVNKQTTSFFDTLTPAFLVSELLATLMAATARVDVRACVTETEEKLWAMGEWWNLN
jgi:DNA-binding MurR/RpiR family transcriptional regulator